MSESSTIYQKIVIESAIAKPTYLKLYLLSALNIWAFYLCVVALIAATWIISSLDNCACAILFIWGIFGFYMAVVLVSALYMTYSPKNSSYFLPTKYTFDDETISVRTDIAQCTVTWKAFIGWKVIADHYVLFNSAITYIAIPKSAIPPNSASMFEQLLRDKIQKK
jgi:hypothetical protein